MGGECCNYIHLQFWRVNQAEPSQPCWAPTRSAQPPTPSAKPKAERDKEACPTSTDSKWVVVDLETERKGFQYKRKQTKM